ncbi:MAG: hypothetical protein H6673_13885 [Anaerolineales bacterium]|nr:hypothetical protein [Anaerolineales bacterium]
MIKRALLLVLLLITACSGDDKNTDNAADSNLRRFDWDRSATSILFQIDEVTTTNTEAMIKNTIPQCTIWGDGRLVWTNYVEASNEVLESRLNDEQIRSFVEFVIGNGFYSWEDSIVPPADFEPVRQTMTLNLYGEQRTVERYGDWDENRYQTVLDRCRTLADARALVVAQGGWIRAYPVERDDSTIQSPWQRNAPIDLAELADQGTATWVDGYWAATIWELTRSIQPVQFLERGNAYLISIEVPGISRAAPPAPQSTEGN